MGFAVIAVGALGCVLAGVWADRVGRERISIWAMAVSGTCALLIGWLLHAPFLLVLAVALIWGFVFGPRFAPAGFGSTAGSAGCPLRAYTLERGTRQTWQIIVSGSHVSVKELSSCRTA